MKNSTTNSFFIIVVIILVLAQSSSLIIIHLYRAYRLLSDPELNAFEAMSKTQFLSMREIVVDCVMATDMAHHFSQVTKQSA